MGITHNLQAILIGLSAFAFFGVAGYVEVKLNPKASSGWISLCLAIIAGTGLVGGLFTDEVVGVIAALVFAAVSMSVVFAFLRKNKPK